MQTLSAIGEHLGRALFIVLLFCPVRAAFADAYDDFHSFAQTAFGAEHDSLIYEWFGSELQPPVDVWEYVSEASVAVSFATNLPATSRIEYGVTTGYELSTPYTDRHYYQHLHHIRGLTPGRSYHYRIVLEDERGNLVLGPDRIVRPLLMQEAIRIPGLLAGPPYRLNVSGGYYLLTADIDALQKAIEIAADGVTLDLGGHTITYNNEPQDVAGGWSTYRDQAAFGVRSVGPDGLRIYNGVIQQGIANDGAHPHQSVGFNPIYVATATNFEAAGLVLQYSGSQMVGLYSHWPSGTTRVHHNVFVDRGSEITDRHGMGSKSLGIVGEIGDLHTYHNLVKRTRQSALNGDLIHDNEIYIDSYAINSYGVPGLWDDREAHGNKIFGTGYHVVAFGWGNQNWWHDNLVHLVGQGPDDRDTEYGNQESLNGFRLTQYASATVGYENSTVERNLVLISGGGCAGDSTCTQARGLQYSSDPHVVNNLIRENTIKVVMGDEITQAATVVTQGQPSLCGSEAPVYYLRNTLISNITNVRMGDYYGAGCNHLFLENEMVRVGHREDYKTLRFDTWFPIAGQYFFDTKCSGGANLELVDFKRRGQEIGVGWTLTASVVNDQGPIQGATVSFRDADGEVLASGETGKEGQFVGRVLEHTQTIDGRQSRMPIRVYALLGEASGVIAVDDAGTKQVTVILKASSRNAPAESG